MIARADEEYSKASIAHSKASDDLRNLSELWAEKSPALELLVFMAEFSDLTSDFAPDIRRMCQEIPGAELMETLEEWCAKLNSLETLIDERRNTEDIVCMFIGLEIANVELN